MRQLLNVLPMELICNKRSKAWSMKLTEEMGPTFTSFNHIFTYLAIKSVAAEGDTPSPIPT